MLFWLQELFKGQPWLPASLWVVGILTFLFFVCRGVYKAWPLLKAFVLTVISIQGLPEFMVSTTATLEQQNQKIEEIHHEVNYNNGSSVKDAVSRLEVGQRSDRKMHRRIERGVKGLYTRVDGIDEQLLELHDTDTTMREDFENTQPRTTIQKETHPNE
jgi:nitrate/TMAO reductase-like tetraheme cytochrome c subunit